uniref:Uncharacterized protein n=1 Tax=Percolomonas cosmopolitus TaxID=63605 RepID=A0A7S1KLU1_9EUKA|mmetsp:Transcript_11282/g.42258  ORF Transcript_11282/g.42258 Transcript_11282/m.42258 type:complete len:557 (+) Transcript_11282:32-1702(+)
MSLVSRGSIARHLNCSLLSSHCSHTTTAKSTKCNNSSLLSTHLQSCHFSHSRIMSYRKKAPQVERSIAKPIKHQLSSPNSRPVNKRQMQLIMKRRLRADRDTKRVRQWRNDLFRAHTIPFKKPAKDDASDTGGITSATKDATEQREIGTATEQPKSDVQLMYERHEAKRSQRESKRQMLHLRNSVQVLPNDVSELKPLPKKNRQELYPTLKTRRITIPSEEFIQLLQNPFRGDALIENDAPLREMLEMCFSYSLRSRMASFFASYESYFRVSEETILYLLKHAYSKQDVWYCINYIRKHEAQRYMDNKLLKQRRLLTPATAQCAMEQAHSKGSLQDMFTVFALFFESPLVNNFEYMQYANDDEYALFSNDKRWKLVPTSTDYILLIERALMKSTEPNYDVEQTILSLMKDPQVSYSQNVDEIKIIEYWIHAYIMGGELNQALDVYRYYVKSKITYDQRIEEASVPSTHKMEEPLRESFALAGDEKTYLWFCENVCPHVLPQFGGEEDDEEEGFGHPGSTRKQTLLKRRPLRKKRVLRKTISKRKKMRTVNMVRNQD